MKFFGKNYNPWLRRKKTRPTAAAAASKKAAAAAAAALKKRLQGLSKDFDKDLNKSYGQLKMKGGNDERYKSYEFTIVRAYLEDDDSYRRLWPDYRVLIAFNSLLLFLLTGGRLEPSRYFKFHRSLGSAATVFQDDDFFIFPCDADTDIEVN